MANGNFGGGIGTYHDPFMIEDLLDLSKIGSINKYFKLANDIDASKEAMSIAGIFTDGKGWVPIGTSSVHTGHASFAGLKGLDFDMKKIKNLYINRPDEDDVGFFGCLGNYNNDIEFIIKRPYFENADIKGKNNVGILAGSVITASALKQYIDGLCCKGTVSGVNYIGGAVGSFNPYNSNQSYMKNVYCECTVSGENYVGGITGNLPNTSVGTTVSFCLSKGKVYGASYVGGIAGGNVATLISNCYSLLDSITRTYGSATTFGRITGATVKAAYLSGNKAISTMKFLS